MLDGPRRTFVGLRYLQSAERKLTQRPIDRPGAAQDIKKALYFAPNDTFIASRAGTILMLAEDYQTAAEVMARHRPTTLDDVISFGHCLLMGDDADRGEELVMRAAALAEQRLRLRQIGRLECALLLNNAAYALAEGERNLVAARLMAEKALRASPLEPAFADTLGWVLFKLRDVDTASFYLERAVRHSLGHPDPVVLYHLGCVYGATNRRSQARWFLTWSLSLDPSRTDAMQALRKLYRVLPMPSYAARPNGFG
jgi:Flp pilus assembly protein TadD